MEANSTEQSQKGKEVFLNMVGLLGLNTEVKDKVSGRNIILSVSTDEPGRLIGRNGSSLDNVGLLMNRILKKTDNTFPKVIIDVDGYDKKSKRDKRKPATPNRRDKRVRSAAMEKTIVLDDAPAEDQINVYVDHETDSIAPVTTVALNSSDKNNSRPQQRRGRDNRRDNNKPNNRRDNRRDNNRSNNRNRNEERAPQQETAGAAASSAPAVQSSAPAGAPQNSAPAAAKPSTSPAPAAAPQSSAPAAAKPSTSPAPAAAPQSSAPAATKPSTSPAPAAAPQSSAPAADKGGKPANKLQMQCRNTAKEVKRWGEDLLLPPLSEGDCQKALEYFSTDKEVNVKIDSSRSNGDKKRVRVSLKK